MIEWLSDHVFDIWRMFNLFVGVLCVVWSIGGYFKQHGAWNSKSLNMWYSRLMWAIVQCVVSFEALSNHVRWSYTLGFITIAGLSSFAALYKRGSWGYEAPRQNRD